MSHKCPVCESAISEWALRRKFKCPSCGEDLKSNFKVIRIACVMFGGIVSALLFTSIDSNISNSSAVFIAKLSTIPIVLFIYWVIVNITNIIVIEQENEEVKRKGEA